MPSRRSYPYWDKDARSDVHDGADRRHIYLYDPPGFLNNVTNDDNININDDNINVGWSRFRLNYQFQTWVERGGERVSNIAPWTCSFALKEQNGKWAVDGDHTP